MPDQDGEVTKLKIGDVIRYYDNGLSTPKFKMHIIVGFNEEMDEVASVFINTSKDFYGASRELDALQYNLLKKFNTFLDYDSYADCSNIRKEYVRNFLSSLNDDGPLKARHVGKINKKDLICIMDLICKSPEIAQYYFDKYNLCK